MVRKGSRTVVLSEEILSYNVGMFVFTLGCMGIGAGALFTVVILGDFYEGILAPQDFSTALIVLSIPYGTGAALLAFWYWATRPIVLKMDR